MICTMWTWHEIDRYAMFTGVYWKICMFVWFVYVSYFCRARALVCAHGGSPSSRRADRRIRCSVCERAWYLCEECGFAAKFKSKLVRHTKAVHEKLKEFSCQDCNYTASQQSNINLHMEQKHNNEKNFECDKCGYKAALKHTVTRHKKVHKKEGHQKCPACEYTTLQSADIKKHMKSVHLKIKDKACEECSYATSRMENLKEHIKRKHVKK